MLFNSFEFIFCFLPITFILYWCIVKYNKIEYAIIMLTIASLIFYSYWDIKNLPILISSIVFNFLIGTSLSINPRKRVVFLGVLVNILVLVYFKYTQFIFESINILFNFNLNIPDISLPLGVSFFTFTQIAYLIDIYRKETKQYSFQTYCLFVTIFPHLIAGPILYHKKMIPQFSDLRNFIFSSQNFLIGTVFFILGLFKKTVIADALAPWANAVFQNTSNLSFFEAWIGAISYTFQLYFDFSGYSDMAIGLGLLFNFKLPLNFNSPYKATSIIDFWRRWHITLSEFLKYYLYIPLGGNKNGESQRIRNLSITMLLGGLWHGAGLTYIIWGGLHAVYLILNHTWRKFSIKLPDFFSRLLTMFCVIIAWVFFRAETVADAFLTLKAMFNLNNIILPSGGVYEKYFSFLQVCGVKFGNTGDYTILNNFSESLVILFMLAVILLNLKNTQELVKDINLTWRTAFILSLLLFLSLTFMNTTVSEFIYFQF